MPLWTRDEAVHATQGTSSQEWSASGISIDTRTLEPGDLFVALSDQRDGYDFVKCLCTGGSGGFGQPCARRA